MTSTGSPAPAARPSAPPAIGLGPTPRPPEDARRAARLEAARGVAGELRQLSLKTHGSTPMPERELVARASAVARGLDALGAALAPLPLSDRLAVWDVVGGEVGQIPRLVERTKLDDPRLAAAAARLRALAAGAELPGGARAKDEWGAVLAAEVLPLLSDPTQAPNGNHRLEGRLGLGGAPAIEAALARLEPLLGSDAAIGADHVSGLWAGLRNACSRAKRFPEAFFALLGSTARRYPAATHDHGPFDSMAANVLVEAIRTNRPTADEALAMYRSVSDGVGGVRRGWLAEGVIEGLLGQLAANPSPPLEAELRRAVDEITADAAACFGPMRLGKILVSSHASLSDATLAKLFGALEAKLASGAWGPRAVSSFLISVGDHPYRRPEGTAAALRESILDSARVFGGVLDPARLGPFEPLLETLVARRERPAPARLESPPEDQASAAARRAEQSAEARRTLESTPAGKARLGRFEGLLALLVAGGDLARDERDVLVKDLRVLGELAATPVDPVGLLRACEEAPRARVWLDPLAKLTFLAEARKLEGARER